MKAALDRVPRWLLALVAGTAAALAHPPFGFLPGLLGYPLLLWLLDTADADRPLRSAFWRGWLAGAAYFAIGTWWVSEAFLVDIAAHGWMAPIAVAAMAGGVALFWGAAGLVYRRLAPSGLVRVLAFASLFSAFEWLRGHILTGFPWNLPGESWRAGSAMSQTASLVGAYGLTWITLATVCTPALWTRGRDGRPGRMAMGAAVGVLAFLFAWGALRISDADSQADLGGYRVRIVQADIKQSAKYDPAHFKRIVDAYVDLTRRPPPKGERPANFVIWPEGAIPISANEYLAPGTWTRDAIEGALLPNQILMVGAYRYETATEIYNSLIVVERSPTRGLIPLGIYDKHRLVPFGEYMPLDGLMTALGVKALVKVGDGFASGPAPQPLKIPGLPVFQPLICYESLYPGFTRAGARASGAAPEFIVNVSNDAWFGSTSGPLQHLNLASYRAIEEGAPMLRSTPTGVSAVIDAMGRVDAGPLGLGDTGVIDATLPQQRFATIYRRLGDIPFAAMLLLSFGLILGIRVVGPLKRRQNGVKGDREIGISG